MFNLLLHSFIFDCDASGPRALRHYAFPFFYVVSAFQAAGYIAFLPPSPIVTCHPRFIVVKCLCM
jgi:hypothetical protein